MVVLQITEQETPTTKFVGTYGAAVRFIGATVQEVIGGEFVGSGGTANYGVKVQGATAGVYSTGHYLVSLQILMILKCYKLRKACLFN